MPKDCPTCDTTMVPADAMDCARANWVCKRCAPDFVVARATTHTDLKAEKYGYNTEDDN